MIGAQAPASSEAVETLGESASFWSNVVTTAAPPSPDADKLRVAVEALRRIKGHPGDADTLRAIAEINLAALTEGKS